MAICIDIIKLKKVDEGYVYNVKKIGQDARSFYIVVSPLDNTIAFFWDEDLKKLMRIVDLNDPNETIGVSGIDSKLSGIVIGRCMKALRENHFPESMGYYA